jgi:Undecaprenyl-phosphate glucose phosphotransferase
MRDGRKEEAMTTSSTARGSYIDIEVLQRLLKLLDFLAFALATMWLTFAHARETPPNLGPIVGFLSVELALVALLAIRALGGYEIRLAIAPWRNALVSAAAAALSGAALYGLARLFLLDVHPGWLAGFVLFTAGYVTLSRGALGLWSRPLARAGRFRKRLAIVGGGQAAEDAIRTLETSPGLDVEIIGLFDDRNDTRSPDSVRNHRKIGTIAELARFARAHRVDLIIVAIPLSAEARLLQILKKLWELPVDIRISGQASNLKLSPRAYTYLGRLPLLSVFDRPLSGWNALLKEALDRSLALVLLVLAAPIMAATALAIRLTSKGPILFKQRRYGFNNELIEIYKFRSMYVETSDATASRLVSRDDPRVTPVGRFIRKTSIDELPQLFNVLKGELSLVGPRPHATHAKAAEALYEQVVDGYFARHKVKPGITGWAQINGWRGETDTREKIENRVKYDLDYIDRWSLLFDLYIILKTPFALLKAQNAY